MKNTPGLQLSYYIILIFHSETKDQHKTLTVTPVLLQFQHLS